MRELRTKVEVALFETQMPQMNTKTYQRNLGEMNAFQGKFLKAVAQLAEGKAATETRASTERLRMRKLRTRQEAVTRLKTTPTNQKKQLRKRKGK